MAKIKKKSQKAYREKINLDLESFLPIKKGLRTIILFFFLLLSVGLSYYYISYAYTINQQHGFPLDDPWIHLTFAKNLIEYGSFSYFKDEIVTAGSTSPIYTLLLAGGFLITKNEMILSYVLGILFLAASVFSFYKLSEDSFPKENWLAISATIIFVLDKWMNFIAGSGMETTMFIFLLIICFYYYRKRNAVLFGITLGLIVWARPDGIAFIGALILDYSVLLYFKRKSPKDNSEFIEFSKTELIKIASIFFFIIILYVGMNLILSGSVLPNTYDAKLTYYSPDVRSRADFLKNEVWGYFTDSAYALFVVPFFIALLKIIADTSKSKYNSFLLPAVFIFALLFIYWYKLPYAHRFGRYLMPIFPFYILMFVYGSRKFFRYLFRYLTDKKIVNGLNMIFLGVVIVYSATAYIDNKHLYAEQTNHISIRQVAVAKWLRDNTPEGSVIATHDVGAIGYYSNRKIVDVAGLINPELIKKLLERNYSQIMTEEMKKRNVSYTAFLREWYQVVNQDALYVSGDKNFEIMEVYKFDPLKTHILNRTANSMNYYAMELIQNKQFQQAVNILNKSINADPASSLTYYYIAYAYSALGDQKNSEKYLMKALELYPGFREAALTISEMYKNQKRYSDSKRYIESYLRINPSDTAAIKLLASLLDTVSIK
ncbi:MAG: hypothetical protein ACRDFC_01060 [Ignavibacteria bacterium]